MAAEEQQAAEDAIVAKQIERKLLINEQSQAGAIVGNLKSLLGLDLDGDGQTDDLDRAIAAFGETPVEANDVEAGDDDA